MAVTSISNLAQLTPANARITGYDKKLRARATLKDIYVNLQGLYSRTEQQIPNAIYMKIDEQNAGAEQLRLVMKLPLTGAIVKGNTRLFGTEVSPITKTATVYRNNYKFAVKTETYNTRKLDQQNYGLYDQHIKDLGLYAQQHEGLQIRQALLQTYPADMVGAGAGDLSALSQLWSSNIFVQGATDAQQPVYDSTPATYIEAIGDALAFITDPSFRMLNRVAIKALSKLIMPLDINGNDAFVFVCSPLCATVFADPTFGSGATISLGGLWKEYTALPEKMQHWYGILGCFKSSIGVDIYVTVDPKCPVIDRTGADGAWVLTGKYVDPGDVDNRAEVGLMVDANILLGRGALAKWEPEKMHFVTQDDDYDRLKGTGFAGVRGIQALRFDQESPNDTSIEYYGSMLVLTKRPAYV